MGKLIIGPWPDSGQPPGPVLDPVSDGWLLIERYDTEEGSMWAYTIKNCDEPELVHQLELVKAALIAPEE